MRRAAIAAASLALVAGGYAAGRLIPGSGPSKSARQAVRYQCPMHPAFSSDTPGTAPCCGMALEPVQPGAEGPRAAGRRMPGTVTIDSGLRQLQGVRLGVVEKGSASQSLRLFGRVVPDETRVFTVNAAMEGSIRELSGVTTGSLVKRDQVLGTFFSADLRSPLQAYLTSLEAHRMNDVQRSDAGLVAASGSTPGGNVQFAEERLRGMGVSGPQLVRMRQRRELPLTIDILSPVDGLVVARSVTLGQRFDRGAEWFRIANLDRVWVLADVLEADAPLVRPGATARVTVPGRAGELVAVVSRVPPQFDAESRTLKVRLEVENPGATLRPDMLVDVGITVERPEAITVPADAVVDSGLRRTVFVETAEGVYEPRRVETGWRAGDRVQVTSGLEPGERIVVSGTFLVDSESQLRAAAAGVRAGGALAHDPVCGMDVDEAKARAEGKVATVDGKAWYFCSESCRDGFVASHAHGGSHAHGDGPGAAAPTRIAGAP
ncbi:MAG TPA: efflux RND transporter periplasmic adaptor subunit [Anaeromyxobacteraceae bacterium]|nr:efflux RND transporter periplasmic adaptor subunit [Anaeromyxobacteraceae bacterium]